MTSLAVPPRHPKRLVYLGTPEMAVPPLKALVDAGYDIALVVTRADKRRGRGGHLMPSPVKAAAIELGLPVTSTIDEALEVGADLGVVVAFGRIIKPHVLEQLPMINTHFSLLPRWRGAAPVERAILAGDDRTGVDIMAIEEGLDTGGIYSEAVLDIAPDETADELRARLVEVGTALLLATLSDGIGTPLPQEGETTYAEKIDPEELHIDWATPAQQLHRVVRVGNAWTMFRSKRFKVWRAMIAEGAASPANLAPGEIDGLVVGTSTGALELVEVQPEGKPRQGASAWRNGARPQPGERLGL